MGDPGRGGFFREDPFGTCVFGPTRTLDTCVPLPPAGTRVCISPCVYICVCTSVCVCLCAHSLRRLQQDRTELLNQKWNLSYVVGVHSSHTCDLTIV